MKCTLTASIFLTIIIFIGFSIWVALLQTETKNLESTFNNTNENSENTFSNNDKNPNFLGFLDPRKNRNSEEDNDVSEETETYKRNIVSSNDRIILQPPKDGIYLGAVETGFGDIFRFEEAINRKSALVQMWPPVVSGIEELGQLNFNVSEANKAFNNGYVPFISAYEASPAVIDGFIVDDLVKGNYDKDLKRFADSVKQFGKPFVFMTARELNGVLEDMLGGFGPNGDKEPGEVSDRLGQFNPNQYDLSHLGNKDIFSHLGNNNSCDGMERMAAAHLYYYDFFVNREGIDFITFETMAWNAIPGRVLEKFPECNSYGDLLSMIKGHYDWISINWYLTPDVDEQNNLLPEPSLDFFGNRLDNLISEIETVDKTSPIMINELGFCRDDRDEKARYGLNKILNTPRIKAAYMWGEDQYPVFKCGITKDNGGVGYKEIVDLNPNKFHSCAQFSDGSVVPNCTNAPTNNVLQQGSRNDSCHASCLATGETQEECNVACGSNYYSGDESNVENGEVEKQDEDNSNNSSCYSSCLSSGESQEECNFACGNGGGYEDEDSQSSTESSCYQECRITGETHEECTLACN